MVVPLPVKRFCRNIPLLGGLVDARWRDHREAIKEIGINIFVSTAPIWLGVLFLELFRKYELPLGQAIRKNVETGELFLYATSILAPLYYFIFKEGDGIQRFPNAGSFILSSLIVVLVGVAGFTFTRLGPVLGISLSWDEATVFTFSLKLYLISIIIVYLAHVYRNRRETGGPAAYSTDTQDFVAAFNQGPKS
jgi:hypothetical protein